MILFKNEMVQTDPELIASFLNGDENAFEELAGRYFDSIYRFIFRLTNGRSETDDLTAETFIKAWKNLKRFKPRGDGSFRPWLYRIARNSTLDFFRKKRIPALSEFTNDDSEDNLVEENAIDSNPLPDEVVFRLETSEIISKSIEKLPIRNREIILMRYIEDLTFPEICDILEKPLETVKSLHYRGLIKIRKFLDIAHRNGDI